MNSSLSTVSSALRDCRHCEGEGERTGKQLRPALPPPARPSAPEPLRAPGISSPGHVDGSPSSRSPSRPCCPHPRCRRTQLLRPRRSPHHSVLRRGHLQARVPALDARPSPLLPATSEARRGPAGSCSGKSRAPVTGGPWQPRYHLSTGHTAAAASPRERPRPGCTHTLPSRRPLTPTRGPRADRRLAKAPRPPVAQRCPLSPRPVPGRPRAGEAQPKKARRLTWGHTQAGASGPSIRAAPTTKAPRALPPPGSWPQQGRACSLHGAAPTIPGPTNW